MPVTLIPLFSYVVISTFTPGPSNISSATLGVLHGYKKTLSFQAGLAVGVFVLMFISGLLTQTLLSIFPALEPILRYIGAVYILYLAYGVLKAGYSFTNENVKPLGFLHGFTLQILNPKLLVYAFTVFSAFLSAMITNVAQLVLAAFLLAAISFCATSLWAIFGTAIKNYLRNPRLTLIVNVVLALALIYTAVALTGLLPH